MSTTAQRTASLEVANGRRAARAQFRRRMQILGPEGAARSAATLMLDGPPEDFDTWDVGDYLLAVPRIGKTFARNMLGRHTINPWKPVGALLPTQRRAVAYELTAFADRRARKARER